MTCDLCHRRAHIRFADTNLCTHHLNRPYKDVKLADGTSYVQEVATFVTSGKSPAGFWEDQ